MGRHFWDGTMPAVPWTRHPYLIASIHPSDYGGTTGPRRGRGWGENAFRYVAPHRNPAIFPPTSPFPVSGSDIRRRALLGGRAQRWIWVWGEEAGTLGQRGNAICGVRHTASARLRRSQTAGKISSAADFSLWYMSPVGAWPEMGIWRKRVITKREGNHPGIPNRRAFVVNKHSETSIHFTNISLWIFYLLLWFIQSSFYARRIPEYSG